MNQPEFYKIKDHDDLIKSTNSKAVLNVDGKALHKYREEREKLSRLVNVVEETRRLDKEVMEIKDKLDLILGLLRNKD